MSRHDVVKRHEFRSAMKTKEKLSSMKSVRFDGIYTGKEAEVGHGGGGGCPYIYIYIYVYIERCFGASYIGILRSVCIVCGTERYSCNGQKKHRKAKTWASSSWLRHRKEKDCHTLPPPPDFQPKTQSRYLFFDVSICLSV